MINSNLKDGKSKMPFNLPNNLFNLQDCYKYYSSSKEKDLSLKNCIIY